MLKLAREGYPYIIFFGALTLLLYASTGIWGAIAPSAATLFMAYFFRDPDRITPDGEGLFISPADGKIILIENIDGAAIPYYTGSKGADSEHFVKISIFMSPFNVHVNRSPCDGTVESVIHTAGKFLSAFKHEASLQNDSITITLITPNGNVILRQVAGFLARRAVCRVKQGDYIRQGDRFGIIKFSSRVDIFLPATMEICVKLNDTVKAGESILGAVRIP
jgi:phosphatidylserine decarboxylase